MKSLKNWQKVKISRKNNNKVTHKPLLKTLPKSKNHISDEQKYLAVLHYTHYLRSLRKVSKIYKISKSSLQRWVKKLPRTRQIKEPKQVKEIKTNIKDCILTSLKTNPLLTMDMLTKIICKECKLKRSKRSVNRDVKSLGLTFKDSYRYVDYKHDNNKIKEFCNSFRMAHEGKVLISIDEAGFYVGEHRRKGWCHKGKRVLIKGDKSLQRTKFTIIVAIGQDGIAHYEVLDHNCNKNNFVNFIKNMKVPEGAILLMDNLKCHHSLETLTAADLKGYEIFYTPPYSPKMNPIENLFGAIKPEYRRRCSPYFDKNDNYKAVFREVINDFENRNLFPFFNHTMKIVKKTLEDIEKNPEGYIFIGYDE
jgi:transposase